MRDKKDCGQWLDNCEGKGALGCLLSILLLGGMVIFAAQAGPPYFSYRSLEGDVKTEVSRAGAHFYSNQVLLQNILDVAKKNEVPLKNENIKVERLAGQVKVTINYSVPVDFVIFERVIDFQIKASSFVGAL